MVAVPVQRLDVFVHASQLLRQYHRLTPTLRSHGLEVALAIQYSRDTLPWVGATQGLTLAELAETICDPFFAKSHPQLPQYDAQTPLIWPLFNQDEHGVLQPLPPTHAGEWHWFKACNGQVGVGCHAVSLHMWRDSDFLNGDRDQCPLRFYDGHFPLSIDQGRQRCRFDDHPCGWEAGYPKMLQVVGSGSQAEVFRSEWTEAMWAMLVPPTQPIPVYPVIALLYSGHEGLQQGRQSVTPEQFCQDLDLSPWQFKRIFDADLHSTYNRQLLAAARQPTAPEPRPGYWQPQTPLPQPLGGHVLLEPDAPPTFQTSGSPAPHHSDPLLAERRRRRQLERSPAHNELLKQFRRWFRLAGMEVREDQHYFDFLAVKDSQVLLAEIKLLYHQDIAETMQELVGQLLYYEHFTLGPWQRQGYQVQKAAVLDRPPYSAYIDFLRHHGIITFWLTENGEIDGAESALRRLRQMGVQVRPDPKLLDTRPV